MTKVLDKNSYIVFFTNPPDPRITMLGTFLDKEKAITKSDSIPGSKVALVIHKSLQKKERIKNEKILQTS